MYTIYNTTLISENCPQEKTPFNCPLRNYVNSEKDLFHVSVNETHLVPNVNNRETLIRMYDEMHAICDKCHLDNQQKTK